MATGDTAQTQRKRQRIALFVILYATMFLFGLVENIKGVSLPLIKNEFGVSYDSQGGLVSITWFGYVAFCLIASLFLQRFGLKRSMLAGFFLVCAGAVATTVVPSFWMASLALIVVNAGFGFFEVGTNALGTVAFTRKAALMMGLLHFFYGFGAIVGPRAAGLLTSALDYSWRQVYIAAIVPTAVLSLFVLLTKFDLSKDEPVEDADQAVGPSHGVEQKQRSDCHPGTTNGVARVTFFGALRNPVVWMFAVTLGFMEVIEFGAANWGTLHLQDVYRLDPRTVGASFVSAFYILFTLSRLFSGMAVERAGYMRSLHISTICTIVALFAGFALGESGIWILPSTGLFIGIMWPTMMAVAMTVFGADAPIATSAIITVSGAINGIMQLVIGFTNEIAGEAWGYRSCLLYAGVALLSLRLLDRSLQARSPHSTVSSSTTSVS